MADKLKHKAEQPPFPVEAVVRIGDGGRGFILEVAESRRYVVTAAHCLPAERLPTPHLANSSQELTFPQFIGPLAKRAKRTIWGELCVCSLTDDIAAFSEPDGQDFYEQAAEYGEFIDGAALKLGASPPTTPLGRIETHTPAWVLSLDGIWMPCTVCTINGRFLMIRGAEIESGMSGSPILNTDGAAIGLVSTSGGTTTGTHNFSINPILADCLPPWLLRG